MVLILSLVTISAQFPLFSRVPKSLSSMPVYDCSFVTRRHRGIANRVGRLFPSSSRAINPKGRSPVIITVTGTLGERRHDLFRWMSEATRNNLMYDVTWSTFPLRPVALSVYGSLFLLGQDMIQMESYLIPRTPSFVDTIDDSLLNIYLQHVAVLIRLLIATVSWMRDSKYSWVHSCRVSRVHAST